MGPACTDRSAPIAMDAPLPLSFSACVNAWVAEPAFHGLAETVRSMVNMKARSERRTASGYSDRSSGAHAYAAVQVNPARPNSIA